MNSPTRRQCYFEIRDATRKLAEEYASTHPEWAGDERARVGTEWTLKLFETIFKILDKYDLKERPKVQGAQNVNDTQDLQKDEQALQSEQDSEDEVMKR